MVAIVVLVLFGALWFGRGTPVASVATADSVAPAPSFARPAPRDASPVSSETVTVHVAGEVIRPGLVVVGVRSRLADVIAAAGGATPLADLSLVNLAAAVADGAQIIVPRFGSPPEQLTVAGPESDGMVHVNSADLEELMRLPGVGPVTARQIIEYRTAHGPFAVVEDLLDVPGIGEGKLVSLREGVVVP